MKLTPVKNDDWLYINGNFEGNNGERQMYPFAVNKKKEYCSFRAKFRFIHKTLSQFCADAGMVFGASSKDRFYVLHFPACNQAVRSKNFWVAISEYDGSGYLKLIDIALMNRVLSNTNIWHDVELEYKDGDLKITVDRKGTYEVKGSGIRSGNVGLMRFDNADISDLEIEGDWKESKVDWGDDHICSENFFYPYTGEGSGKYVYPVALLKDPHGKLKSYLVVHDIPYGGNVTALLLESDDKGITWSDPVEVKGMRFNDSYGLMMINGNPHYTPDGSLVLSYIENSELFIQHTDDNGRSWNEPVKVEGMTLPTHLNGKNTSSGLTGDILINLSDGNMLGSIFGEVCGTSSEGTESTWSAWHTQAFSYKINSRGKLVSGYSELDSQIDTYGNRCRGCMDINEVSAVELENGHIYALGRPNYSPWMWECNSYDYGASWTPATHGPFPGYGASNILKTSSGNLVLATRIPGTCIHVSRDDGLTWDRGTMIDTGGTVMGTMVETGPDQILYIYYYDWESRARAQFFRVTDDSVIPVKRFI